ncbi:MAG: hypothetical protein GFH27_549411n28 [Chloroflexi bacterium AL-W]|nr:hypothetical protein [Chloroflexi bacterium AL-W]
MNWLIVEDEADIRNLVVMMCQVWGNTPIPHESGQKAWEWLDSIEAGTYNGLMPDFALMDIRMPGKRGNEISARMRTIPLLQNIPIVLMTAFVMSEEEMERMRREFGVDEVINKPLPDFDQLRMVLYGIIERKQAQNAATPAVESAPSAPTQTAASNESEPAQTTPLANEPAAEAVTPDASIVDEPALAKPEVTADTSAQQPETKLSQDQVLEPTVPIEDNPPPAPVEPTTPKDDAPGTSAEEVTRPTRPQQSSDTEPKTP